MWVTTVDLIDWTPTARAIVLPDGDVLRIIPKGGVRADVYRPANNSRRRIILSIFQFFGDAFSMSVLRSGRVLIVNSRCKTQELDTDTGIFTDLGSIPREALGAVKWAAQATMPSGDVFYLSSDGASVFREATREWEPPVTRPPFFDAPSPVHACEMVALNGGQLFLLGIHFDGTGLTYTYDEATDTWTKFIGQCDWAVRRIAAMLDGRALVCKVWGGVDIFDPLTGEWTPVTLELCELHMPFYALPAEFPDGGVGIVGRTVAPRDPRNLIQGNQLLYRIDAYTGNSAWTTKLHPTLPTRLRRRATEILLISSRIRSLGNLPYLMIQTLSADKLM